MKKLYFTSVFILVFSIGFGQSYPYLNASTANENEFPVDKDTNIYMFHGNRLVKTDKNFNTIWANTYSGFTFSSLLLSKTGSMYFIGSNGMVGKISANGTLSWARNLQMINAILSGSTSATFTGNCQGIILDRNNNLVLAGNSGNNTSFLLKMDTIGNGIKLKIFDWSTGATQLENLTIIGDSAGYYKLFGYGMTGTWNMGFSLYSYSDNLDAFTGIKTVWNGNYANFYWKCTKSKFWSGFYVRIKSDLISPSGNINEIVKFGIDGTVKWMKRISATSAGLIQFIGHHLEEGHNGDLLFASSTSNSNMLYTSAIVKIDSNGVANNSGTTMLSSYNISPSMNQIPAHFPHSHYNNNYFFDVSGYYFPANPLTIQKFNSSLTFACASTVTSTSSNASFPTMLKSSPVIKPVTSFSLMPFVSTTTPVSFSVNTNFCLVMGTDVTESLESIKLYPNPANDKLYISEKNYAVNSMEIFDVNGKSIKSITKNSSVDVSNLPNGIYFIRIKTDKGEFNKKFIKN